MCYSIRYLVNIDERKWERERGWCIKKDRERGRERESCQWEREKIDRWVREFRQYSFNVSTYLGFKPF